MITPPVDYHFQVTLTGTPEEMFEKAREATALLFTVNLAITGDQAALTVSGGGDPEIGPSDSYRKLAEFAQLDQRTWGSPPLGHADTDL